MSRGRDFVVEGHLFLWNQPPSGESPRFTACVKPQFGLDHTNYCQNQNQLYKGWIQELLKRRVQRNFFRGKQLFIRPRLAEPSSTPRSYSTPHYQVNTLPCPWIVLIRGGNCRPLKDLYQMRSNISSLQCKTLVGKLTSLIRGRGLRTSQTSLWISRWSTPLRPLDSQMP